ncbi:MAG: hypothetical protein WAX89_00475 [Alphaproteobacteria bacterium]
MYQYFKLAENEKDELMGIAERLKASAAKNLTPQRLPADVTEDDVAFAETHRLPLEFFQYFTVETVKTTVQDTGTEL